MDIIQDNQAVLTELCKCCGLVVGYTGSGCGWFGVLSVGPAQYFIHPLSDPS